MKINIKLAKTILVFDIIQLAIGQNPENENKVNQGHHYLLKTAASS